LLIDCNYLEAQVDYHSPDNVYQFADYLYKIGDYSRAIGEYQRYLFISNSHNYDSIYYKIGLCYEYSNNPETARNIFFKIVNTFPNSDFLDRTYYQIAFTYYKNHDYDYSIAFAEDNISKMSTVFGKYKLYSLICINNLYEKKWEAAYNNFNILKSNEYKDFNDSVSKLEIFTIDGMNLKYKSVILASLFSAFIPGSGKMYTGRINDGIYSFATIGISAWQAYDGFRSKGANSVKGWIYGILGTTLYLGNIYGSAVSVQIYNNKLEENIYNRISIDLTWQ
jgi:tetratricopeptide (TPR) repeat protein